MALVILRHGPTAATPESGAPRASGPNLPLSPDARAILTRTVQQLPKVDAIYASPLHRAAETAAVWHQHSGAPIKILKALESWNLGKYRGQHSAAADALVKDLLQHPDRKPPGGGESFHAFLRRVLPVAGPLMADGQAHGMVGHSRTIKTLQAWVAAGGQGIDRATWQQAPLLKPGEAIELTPQGQRSLASVPETQEQTA